MAFWPPLIPYIGFAVGTAIAFIVGLVTFPALSDALLPPTIYPGYPG
jgi:predicted PurR-regulated permease PerM